MRWSWLIVVAVALSGCGHHVANEPPKHNEVGNGGDPLAIEFVSRAYYVIDAIRNARGHRLVLLTEPQIRDYEAAVKDTPVEIVDDTLYDNQGVLRTAIVVLDPARPGKRKILVNRARWREELAGSLDLWGFVNVIRSVFHEYLWVIGVDDTNYRVSQSLSLTEDAYQAWRRAAFGLPPVEDGASPELSNVKKDGSFGSGGLLWFKENTFTSRMTKLSHGKFVVARGYLAPTSHVVLTRHFPDGQIDPSFGKAGKLNVYLATRHTIAAIAAQKDDGVVLVTSDFGSASTVNVFRVRPDGTFDETFGLNHGLGIATPMLVTAVTIQPDDKIVIAGMLESQDAKKNKDRHNAFIFRINADGHPDETFGNKGAVGMRYTADDDAVTAIAAQPDGRLIVAGYTGGKSLYTGGEQTILTRLLPNGVPDPSFVSGRATVIQLKGTPSSIALQKDGKILLGMNLDWDKPHNVLLGRFLPDGKIDPRFGDGGLFRSPAVPFQVSYVFPEEDKSRILLVGVANVPYGPKDFYHSQAAVLRVVDDGRTADPLYGLAGMALLLPGADISSLTGALLDEEGRLLALGSGMGRGLGLERLLLSAKQKFPITP